MCAGNPGGVRRKGQIAELHIGVFWVAFLFRGVDCLQTATPNDS